MDNEQIKKCVRYLSSVLFYDKSKAGISRLRLAGQMRPTIQFVVVYRICLYKLSIFANVEGMPDTD